MLNFKIFCKRYLFFQAERRFEQYARLFLQKTLEFAREMRPLASWGYYIFPMCFNGASNETLDCPDIIKRENDKYVLT